MNTSETQSPKLLVSSTLHLRATQAPLEEPVKHHLRSNSNSTQAAIQMWAASPGYAGRRVQWEKMSLNLHYWIASSFALSFKWDLLGKLHYIRTCVKGLRGFVLPQKLIWTDLVRACSGCFGLFQYTSRVSQISQLFNSTILVCSGQLMRREEFIERRCL